MFEQVFDNLRTITEANVHMQQELMKKWVAMWPGIPTMPNGGADQVMRAQTKWIEFMAELVKKQRGIMEAQFGAGMKNIEEAFRLAAVKNPEELRAKTVELWQKIFDSMRQTYEAQMRDFQAAVVKWAELMMKGAVTS